MTFSFDVSNIFKESPTGGRSTASSIESKPGKVATVQPVADSDPSAEDAGTRNILKFYASDFGDGLQLIVLLCIPCNLRALTNSWLMGTRKQRTESHTGFSDVLYTLCRCRDVVWSWFWVCQYQSVIWHRPPFQDLKARINQIVPEVSYDTKTHHCKLELCQHFHLIPTDLGNTELKCFWVSLTEWKVTKYRCGVAWF